MIKTLTLLITLSAGLSYADTTFDEQKARTLKYIEERATMIASHKVCVEKATTSEAIRECNKAQRMAAMKQKHSILEEKK